ncbi:hypothetical protein [Pedobacter zeae]|uniref:Uncharacterized protein n=1 Tax=Pedobacter zeae TaxID=1737356 RepID=A0A7W6K920_9SPHI|nr:hypothetical protein [Pedobacter zeae]MBB4106385.1 hypothetical protein [Pedobacter zeae]GGH01343.1 hypothetical protein GCM10007422_15100 [Pedobacter zeae]
MKTNKILLAILLLITVCQTRDILDPEIRKIQWNKQRLFKVAVRFSQYLIAFEKERTSGTVLHFMRKDDACESICLSFKLPLICANTVTSFDPHRLNQNLKIMIVLKSDYFSSHERLTRFINENHIKREDILAITQAPGCFAIFFYADDAVVEITHGLFS